MSLESLKSDKPVLLIGSNRTIEKFDGYADYFTLSTGKALYAVDHVNVVTSLDMIRIIHTFSNFRKRWDHYLIPHFITNHLWYGRETEILKPRQGSFVYTRRPAYSSMFFELESFFHMNKNPGFYDGYNIAHPSVSYEDADEIIDFSRFKATKFTREDVGSIEDLQNDDGVLRNVSSSVHLLLNWLWLKGVKKVKTIGVSKEHKSWEDTQKLFSIYNMTHERIEDEIDLA